MLRNSFALCITVVALYGCPDETNPEVQLPDGGVSMTLAHTVSSTRTTTVATIIPVPPPPPPPVDQKCENAPKWVGQKPCVKDGFLYAAGEIPSASNTFLARSSAANRARKQLAQTLGAHDNDRFKLNNSEIDQIFHCGGVIHALARVPRASKDSELQTCASDQTAAVPIAEGCPAWTGRMSWREGDTFYGVAESFKVMNRSLAEQAAANRARQAVVEMLEVELKLSPKGVKTVSTDAALSEKKRSVAECNGVRWMMVAFQKGGSGGMPSVTPRELGGPAGKMRRDPKKK